MHVLQLSITKWPFRFSTSYVPLVTNEEQYKKCLCNQFSHTKENKALKSRMPRVTNNQQLDTKVGPCVYCSCCGWQKSTSQAKATPNGEKIQARSLIHS